MPTAAGKGRGKGNSARDEKIPQKLCEYTYMTVLQSRAYRIASRQKRLTIFQEWPFYTIFDRDGCYPTGSLYVEHGFPDGFYPGY